MSQSSWSCLCFLQQAIGGRAGGVARLDQDSHIQPCSTAPGRAEGREARRPQPSALPWWCPPRSDTDRLQCLYLTPRCVLRCRTPPPSHHRALLPQAWASCWPITNKAGVTGSSCSCSQLPLQKPLPSMSSCDSDSGGHPAWLLLQFFFKSVSWQTATFWPPLQLANSSSVI